MGDGTVQLATPDGSPHTLGLLNVAQMCHQLPGEKWADQLQEHFDRMFRAQAESEAVIAAAEADFEKARPMLRVRLYPEDVRSSVAGEHMVARDVAPGILSTLVYDLPDTVMSVPQSHADGWGRSLDELFRAGTENARAEGRLEAVSMPLDGGAELTLLQGETFYASSHVLFLVDYLYPLSPFGALVSVPNRQAVLFHKIEDLRVIQAINTMIVLGHNLYQEGPGSISPQLYWWRDGDLTLVPSQFNNKKIDFSPPDEFVQVLNCLEQPRA
jgi:hypothetical protein